ncbi:MAG TPA: hypothetical protein VH081_07890 [Solirubrobacteraceae bacterium]|jgi:hypothetical protein|nr:hypothetical protein [Solirubrobacteraceae bacterium]
MPEAPAVGSSPDASPPSRPKVIYILGSHRIGSTVLGVALGNAEGVFFAGELHAWQSRRGLTSFGGEAAARFWGEVLDGVPEAEALFGGDTQRYVDRSSVLYRPQGWLKRRRLKPRYRRVARDLYSSIATAAGATHIVDSSHYPLRALELQAIEEIDLYMLFLVREPGAIVASRGPEGTGRLAQSALKTNAQLWVTYVLCTFVFLRHPRTHRMFVRHEDFRRDPEAVLRQILDRADCPSPVPDLDHLDTGVPLQGNRFLKRGETVAIRRSDKAETRPSALTYLMQLPWSIVFRRLQPAVMPERPATVPAQQAARG